MVLSHANDTVTAHEAAEWMQKSGKAKIHKAQVLAAVADLQGQTCAEIGEITGLGHIEAQRRVSDLKNDGLIEYRGRRDCKVKGSAMSTVYLTEHGAKVMDVVYYLSV